MGFAIFIAAVAAIVLTVYLCIKVLPAKHDGTFDKKPLQLAHDYFNFKKLYLESVLKILFTFLTVASVIGGVVYGTIGNIFQFIGSFGRAVTYGYEMSWVWGSLITNFFIGVGIAVLGPIVLRLVYEGLLMFILLVKNVIEINNKMKTSQKKENE